MKLPARLSFVVSSFAAVAITACAAKSSSAVADNTQATSGTPTPAVSNIGDCPDFINLEANVIVMPEKADKDAWRAFAAKLTSAIADDEIIDIMHIGDSHIQAEMGTSVVRDMLQSEYGNAGRGLISAFKLAGTNQPVDYEITALNHIDGQVRLLKRPWPIQPGFTGVAACSDGTNTVTYRNLKPNHRFNKAIVFTSNGKREATFAQPVDSGRFDVVANERIFGVYTCNTDSAGIVYSTIGNNGACFSDYLLLDNFAADVAVLNPRLIVLSMGTNEGYSSKSDSQILSETRELIKRLRAANPEALFLMWMPMECEKKAGDDGSFKVQARVKDARNLLRQVSVEEGIPYWDFYEVAGGDGAASRWVDAGIMNPKDHVHLLGAGYRLQGRLAATAFIDFINTLNTLN